MQIAVNNQTIDLVQYVTTAVDNLANTYSGLFLATVQTYVLPLLIAGLVIAGLFWLFDHPHRAMQHLGQTLFAYIAVVWMLRYYNNPMPLVGIPFGQIFRMEGRFLSAKIDIGLLNVFLNNVSSAFSTAGSPNPLNIFQVIAYFMVMVSMGLPELALFVETTFAIVALGIGALLGPIFVVLYLAPFGWCKALFHSWLHAMIKYALYRVFASALVFIWASAQLAFVQGTFNGQYSLAAFTASLLGLFVFNVGCFILCLRLPRLVTDFTSGTANAGGGLVGTAVSFGVGRLL